MKREDITPTHESGQYYRDHKGRKVRVYSLDTGGDWVHAAHRDEDAEIWAIYCYMPEYLTPMPKELVVWVNEYPDGFISGQWRTKENANARSAPGRIRLHRVVIGPDTIYEEYTE